MKARINSLCKSITALRRLMRPLPELLIRRSRALR